MKRILLAILLPLGLFELNEQAVQPQKNPWIGVPVPVPVGLC